MREVEDKPLETKLKIHLAGIIPLCGQQYRDKKLPWHPAMLPVNDNTLLIDLAIAQCAYVGCDTIWVIIDDYLEQFFRERIGEWVYDPKLYGVDPYKGVDTSRKIAVYYIPENSDDRDRRDSVAFQVIRGMEMARKITGQISSYVIPDQYFVTFPYSVYDYRDMGHIRKQAKGKGNLILEHEGKSIKTGHYVPFIMNLRAAKQCKNWVWKNATGVRDMSQPKEEWQYGKIPTKKLPESEQYSGRYFGPDKVYKAFYDDFEYETMQLNWFHDVSTFEGYRKYMGSDNYLHDLNKTLFKSREWNSMSFDDREFEEE